MVVTIDIKDFGLIDVELYPEIAPVTVENFLKLIDENFYENSSFHRIIKGFMIQGGMQKKPAYPIYGEFKANGFKNDLKHVRGVISMARTSDPNSANSQFFIMHQDSSHLDSHYAAFGKVIEGIEVVDKIAKVSTDHLDAPLQKIVINNIKRK